jgi:outer membrane protein, multidrug efflux system
MTHGYAVRQAGTLLAAGGMFMLSSCGTVAPRASVPHSVPIPASWQEAAAGPSPLDTAALSAWWIRFDDPVLSELIAGALQASPDVHSALARVEEFRARRGLEHAALFPAVGAMVSGGRTRVTDRDSGVGATRESYSASVDGQWQVDLFGRQRLANAAAAADLAGAEENYHGAQVALAAAVASAYVTLRSAEGQLAVLHRSLGARSETAQLTRWREQAGTGSALDTQRALATLEFARAEIPALQLEITRTRNQLARLSGRVPGSLDRLLAVPRGVPAAPEDLAAGIPAEVLRQRPDVRAAERALAAAFARSRAAQRARLPALTLTGSIGVEAFSLGGLFNPASSVVSLLAGLTAPVLDAGRITHTIAVQRALERQSLHAYESTVLLAFAEVENALAAVQRQTERLALLEGAAAAAREAESLSTLQYEAGQVDLLVSLDAQRTLLELEQQTVATAAGRAAAYVQLYQALGGGWTTL